MSLQSFVLANITRLPAAVNRTLMQCNRNENWVYGKAFQQYKQFLSNNARQYDNREKLLLMANFAIKNVPYYQKRYDPVNNIEQFRSQLGFIDKGIIADNSAEFLADNIDISSYVLATTGGTTGRPLSMYIPKNRHIVELGTMFTLWGRVGFNHHVRAVIRNARLAGNVDYVINPIKKEIIFDGFRLHDDYFKTIYKVIRKFGIAYIHAYPSTAYEFSRYVVKNGLDISFVRAFLSGSENINASQKEFIELKTGVRFFNWYGHSEKLLLGAYCESSDVYHMEPDYGFFELIDAQGNNITEPGAVGEIVGSTLHNQGMPMLRYRTGDYAEYVGNYCQHCERHLPLIRHVQGRWNGLKIYAADGSVTTTTALNFHDDLHLYITALQYVQKHKGELDILIIKGEGFKQQHHQRLYDYYRSRFSKDTKIEIHYVEQLLRKPNGKFVELISDIKE